MAALTTPHSIRGVGVSDLDRDVEDLAWAISTDGIEAHEPAVARLVSRLRQAGAAGTLLEVVANPSEPAAVRERAFGRLDPAILLAHPGSAVAA